MAKTLEWANGDMVRSGNNQGYSYIADKAKTQQDVELVLTTDTRKSTGLGCGLDSLIGDETMSALESYSQFPIMFDFQTAVRVGLSRLKGAQRRYLFDKRTPQEVLYDFSPVDMQIDTSDFRNFKWRLDILTEDGTFDFSVSGSTRS